ncbi:hypothetical protein H0E84_00810 [Luteimonas sp. SJ-92]|uniref:YCII-related domain-containing protein n=2 Tax=Luteimonas salinisoli TaxID=2752307 RepID=A0A853J7R5_9GAMM|nr:YciI family protein [Luteimonas salinisoli]NZA24915.1 hypothetical protein [Luteimonas salinisoli]
MLWAKAFLLAASQSLAFSAFAVEPADQAPPPGYDAALAESFGADDYGMRSYVLVILKSGPTPMPKGEARDAMFRGHFSNMKRLAEEGKLAVAGPLDSADGWRGLFILAVDDIEAAKALVATDPVIQHGEMVAEYHKYYGSAALMQVNEIHARIAKKGM